jgi:hypothetical protein
MMAKDQIHDAVKQALIKDDWTILADPFHLDYEEFSLSADLAAERSFMATRGEEKIVVEVKTFGGRSFVKELQQALGQYEIYFDILTEIQLDYELYLAVSDIVYETFFEQKATQLIVRRHHLKILVVDIEE